MLVNELAKAAEVSTDTIRFYNRIGLIEAAAREDNGYRQFAPRDVDTVRFVHAAKRLGLKLKEIKDFLKTGDRDASSCCGQTIKLLKRRAEETRQLIRDLHLVEAAIQGAIDGWDETPGCTVKAQSRCPRITLARVP